MYNILDHGAMAEIEDVSFTNITADNTLRVFQCAEIGRAHV